MTRRSWAGLAALILAVGVLGGVIGSLVVRAGFAWDGISAVSTLVQAIVTTILVYVAVRQMKLLTEQARREDIRELRRFLEDSSTRVRAFGIFLNSYLDRLSRGEDSPEPSRHTEDILRTKPESMRWHREDFFPSLQAVYDNIQRAHDATCHQLPGERTMAEATDAMRQLAHSCFEYAEVAEETLRRL